MAKFPAHCDEVTAPLVTEEFNRYRKDAQVLDERERAILYLRVVLWPPTDLETTGQVFGLTRERIRQIEARALSRLRQAHGRQRQT